MLSNDGFAGHNNHFSMIANECQLLQKTISGSVFLRTAGMGRGCVETLISGNLPK